MTLVTSPMPLAQVGAPTFVSEEVLRDLTGKVRHNAQAKWLRGRNIKFIQRDNGSIALRQVAQIWVGADSRPFKDRFAAVNSVL